MAGTAYHNRPYFFHTHSFLFFYDREHLHMVARGIEAGETDALHDLDACGKSDMERAQLSTARGKERAQLTSLFQALLSRANVRS